MPAWRALEGGCKRLALAWPRRHGKDEVALHWAAVSMMTRVGSYWHMLPEAAQSRKAIFDAINPHTGRRRIDDAFPPELRESTREQDMFIRFKNGSTWQVVGSDNYNSLVGSPPVGVVFSEYAMADPNAWAFLRPILAENGGWAIFISTPRGRNHFARLVDYARGDPGWFGQVLTVEDTKAIPMETIHRERKELRMERGDKEAEAIIRQEYYCFPPETLIWTDRGQRPIKEVRVGDIVLSHANRWRKVERLYEHHHKGELIELSATGLPEPIRCTPNHPIRVINEDGVSFSWVAAEDIKTGQFVTLPRARTEKPIVSEQMAEAIAWFIAEGSVCRNAVQITLGHDEGDFANRVIAAFSEWGKCAAKKAESTIQVQVRSTALADFMVSNCGSGATNKRIPWDLIRGHEHLVYETLIDGDGCRGNYRGCENIYTTVSKSLAYDVQMLAHTLGYRASVNVVRRAEGVILGRKVLMNDSYTVRITKKPRTTKTKIKAMRTAAAVRVKSVSRIPYSGPVHNFSVQYDHTYVANGVVVHNCDFDADIPGAYFGELIRNAELQGRLASFPHVIGQPVGTAWDIGVGDSTVIWFYQLIGHKIRIINVLEGSGVGLDWYAKKLLALDYVYGDHIWPHDGAVQEWGSGQSRVQVAAGYGLKPRVLERDSVDDGIQAVRMMLPVCEFNMTPDPFPGETPEDAAARMRRAVDALKQYRRQYDEKLQKFREKPLHDWSSNFADSFRYLAKGRKPFRGTEQARRMGHQVAVADYRVLG